MSPSTQRLKAGGLWNETMQYLFTAGWCTMLRRLARFTGCNNNTKQKKIIIGLSPWLTSLLKNWLPIWQSNWNWNATRQHNSQKLCAACGATLYWIHAWHINHFLHCVYFYCIFFFFFLRKNSSWTYLCWCFIVTTELKIALVAVVCFAAFVPSFLEQRESEEMIRGQWSHGNPPHMGSTPEQNCRITRRRILSAGSTDLAGKSIPRLRQTSVNLIPCTLLESRITL